jgi:hypothetical protein
MEHGSCDRGAECPSRTSLAVFPWFHHYLAFPVTQILQKLRDGRTEVAGVPCALPR